MKRRYFLFSSQGFRLKKFEVTVERFAAKLRFHFLGMALCSLILLIGGFLFRLYSVFFEFDLAADFAILYQSIAVILGGIAVFSKTLLPNIDKLNSEDLVNPRFLHSSIEDWIISNHSSSNKLPYPVFYYYIDPLLVLEPVEDESPYNPDWEDQIIKLLPLPEKGRISLLKYQIKYDGRDHKLLIVLLLDHFRYAIPFPDVGSDLDGFSVTKYNKYDYKAAQILESYYGNGCNAIDINHAVDRLNMALVDER